MLIKNTQQIKPVALLGSFAQMAITSKALDGDWQGDGWGMAWITQNQWHRYRSLRPVWEEPDQFEKVPESTVVIVHARSASFAAHKGDMAFNQPFIDGPYAFVFNGLLKGVALPYPIAGKIGAERIWNILRSYLRTYSPQESLELLREDIVRHTRYVQAFNVGLSDGRDIYYLTLYGQNPEYYNLRHTSGDDYSIVASDELSGHAMQYVTPGQVMKL